MRLVDVHCHLEDERFVKDLDEVIKRAKDVGLNAIVVSGANPEANRQVLELTKKYSIIKASFGLYPIDSVVSKFDNLNDDYPRKMEAFDYKKELEWIKKNKDVCISIGEVGLELQVIKKNKDFEKIKQAQIEVFEAAIKLAEEIKKPLVLHTRGGELEVIEILEKYKPKVPVILHCFGGRKSLIKRAADNGYYFSVPAVIKRLLHFQTLVEMVDLKQLLTETDAPYLAPVAGERSEPKDVAVTINEIARIKKLSDEEVANQIWENYKLVFNQV
jgi:TatD DNase family protein